MIRWQLGVIAASAACLVACTSSSDGPPSDAGSGGTTQSGGATASGGAVAGGTTASGGGGAGVGGATSSGGGTPSGGGASGGGGASSGGAGTGAPDASEDGDASGSGGTAGSAGGAPVTPGTPGAYAPCGGSQRACPGNEECRSLQSLGAGAIINIGVACGADAGQYGCWCGVPCGGDPDCPEPPGGIGEPFCSAGFCRLLCDVDAGLACPSGMRCTQFPEAPIAKSLCDWPP